MISGRELIWQKNVIWKNANWKNKVIFRIKQNCFLLNYKIKIKKNTILYIKKFVSRA